MQSKKHRDRFQLYCSNWAFYIIKIMYGGGIEIKFTSKIFHIFQLCKYVKLIYTNFYSKYKKQCTRREHTVCMKINSFQCYLTLLNWAASRTIYLLYHDIIWHIFYIMYCNTVSHTYFITKAHNNIKNWNLNLSRIYFLNFSRKKNIHKKYKYTLYPQTKIY